MRSFFTHILLICSLLSANIVYWVDYKDNIDSWSPVKANTQNNIKQAELIETYLINYKSRIKNLSERYEIQNSGIVKDNVSELQQMIRWLRSIQTELVEKDDATEVIKSVVEGLKIVNNNLKPYLRVKQREYENKIDTLKIKYDAPAKRMSLQINKLIKQIAAPMQKQNKLTDRQKQILNHLIRLESDSKNLYNFWNRSFESTDEVKEYLRDILRSVRNQLQAIKSLL